MNIFFLFQCPVEAAEALCLAHMKMIVESVQLLYTAHHLHGADFASHPADLKVYRKTHSGHPMALWVASSVPNYRWLHAHATALAARYARLWPGKTHASSLHLPWLATPPATLPHDKHHLHDNLPLTSLATVHPPDGCIGAPLCFGKDADVVAACTVVTPDGRDLTGSYGKYYYVHKPTVFKRPMTYEPAPPRAAAPRKTIAKSRRRQPRTRNK